MSGDSMSWVGEARGRRPVPSMILSITTVSPKVETRDLKE